MKTAKRAEQFKHPAPPQEIIPGGGAAKIDKSFEGSGPRAAAVICGQTEGRRNRNAPIFLPHPLPDRGFIC